MVQTRYYGYINYCNIVWDVIGNNKIKRVGIINDDKYDRMIRVVLTQLPS